jgi:hypothetical protein
MFISDAAPARAADPSGPFPKQGHVSHGRTRTWILLTRSADARPPPQIVTGGGYRAQCVRCQKRCQRPNIENVPYPVSAREESAHVTQAHPHGQGCLNLRVVPAGSFTVAPLRRRWSSPASSSRDYSGDAPRRTCRTDEVLSGW